jgi:two-component system response regulator MprA
VLESLRRSLAFNGYEVDLASNGEEALRLLAERRPDALVLDVMMPRLDGLETCRRLRAAGDDLPVLMLTARDAVSDRVAGLDAGADDYLPKPFALEELLARLRALLRRTGVDEALEVGELRLDPAAHAVTCRGRTASLTPTEFRILGALAARPGEVVRRRELVRTAWPEGAIVHDNTLDVYLARLRRKLGELPGAPGIATAHGVGYRLR